MKNGKKSIYFHTTIYRMSRDEDSARRGSSPQSYLKLIEEVPVHGDMVWN